MYMRVGLTGGIASGKSTVLDRFQELGASVVDADVVAREVVEPGTEGLRQIIAHFGRDFVQPDGTLDRAKLGQLIFRDEKERRKLNNILHPIINGRMRQQMAHFEKEKPDTPVIAEIPLLIENNLTRMFDRIIVVYVPEQVQVERLMKRNGLKEREAKERLKAQIPIEEKRQYADFIVDNSGDVENTRRQVDRIWGALRREMGQDEPSSNDLGN